MKTKGALKPNRALLAAAREGRSADVKSLLDSGADPNSVYPAEDPSRGCETPLAAACGLGHLETARVLLAFGADVNLPGLWGFTPLICAVNFGRSIELVKVLLDAGADLHAKSASGDTALRRLVGRQEADVELVGLLIDRGADFKDYKSDYPPIVFAASFGNKEVVELLLRRRCRIHIKDREGRTPMDAAIQHKNHAVIRLLLEHGADPDSRDRSGFGKSLLEYAADAGDEELIRGIVAAQGRKTAEKRSGAKKKSGALALAARRGSLPSVKALVESGFHVDDRNDEGATGLLMAAAFGKLDVLRYLLQNGADIHARDKKGSTALHYAASEGQDVATGLLLEAGAEVGCTNDYNWTALMQAAWKDRTSTAEMLLAAGSPTDTIDFEKGATAYSLAGASLRRLFEERGVRDRKIRERRPGEKLFLITDCDICGYLPHSAELRHDWSPEEFPGLETIAREVEVEYKAEDTTLLKRCVHCGTCYMQHHFIDTEDAIGGAAPICTHSIARLSLLNQRVHLKNKGREEVLAQDEARYPEIIAAFREIWRREKPVLPNVEPYLAETLEDALIVSGDWAELENVLLRHPNPAYSLAGALDLLAMYLLKPAARRYRYYSVGRSFTNVIRDRLVRLVKKNPAAFAACLKPYCGKIDPTLVELRDDVMKMAKTARLSV